MKKVFLLLKNKNGAGLLATMFIILGLLLIAVPVYSFSEAMIRSVYIRETIQDSIDIHTTKTGKIIAKSVKNGHDYTQSINKTKLLSELQEQLGVRTRYKGYDSNGKFIYEIKNIDIQYVKDKTLKTEISYTLVYQYYFMTKPIFQSEVAIEQHSLYNLKYN